MSLLVLVLGIVATSVGAAAIGFGMSADEIGAGISGTLIGAGASLLSGGLVLLGLAALVREFSHMAAILKPNTRVRLPTDAAAPSQSESSRLDGVAGLPVAESASAANARGEPGRSTQAGVAADSTLQVSASAIERLRSSLVRPERVADAGSQAGADDVPLSPNGAVVRDQPSEPLPSDVVRLNPAAAAAGPAAAPKLDFLFRGKSRPPRGEPIDVVWPRRPVRERPRMHSQAVAIAAHQEDPEFEDATSQVGEARAAILKSGVVDGMAYTLYADGSIEAQLPQGTVRFGSIAELRSHIENNS
jgi:hypothetical protein